MPEMTFDKVAIVGVGLLGGSAGLALKQAGAARHIVGLGRRKQSLDEALSRGAIDEATLEPADAAREADLVLLCTPVGSFRPLVQAMRESLSADVLVTDVGSTKHQVVDELAALLGPDGPFVGSHPMAGSEKKGPAHASADLYRGALCIVTPTDQTADAVVQRVEAFWKMLGMRTLRMTPSEHDQAVAAVSHVPHLLSSMLALAPEDEHLPVAATGFGDMTRLAAGDVEMWRDIVLTNRGPILESLSQVAHQIADLAHAIDAGDGPAIADMLARARARRLGLRPDAPARGGE